MPLPLSEVGFGLIIAGLSLGFGFIGNLLSGIAVEIEREERQEKGKKFSEMKRFFGFYYLILIGICMGAIIFGCVLMSLSGSFSV